MPSALKNRTALLRRRTARGLFQNNSGELDLLVLDRLERGVAAERLTYKGYGETRPIADNNTKEGRAMNRRTTLTPIK